MKEIIVLGLIAILGLLIVIDGHPGGGFGAGGGIGAMFDDCRCAGGRAFDHAVCAGASITLAVFLGGCQRCFRQGSLPRFSSLAIGAWAGPNGNK